MPDYTEHTTLLAVMRREYGILVLVTKGKEKKILSSLESWRHPGLLTRDSFLFFQPMTLGMEPPSLGHTLLNVVGVGPTKRIDSDLICLNLKSRKVWGLGSDSQILSPHSIPRIC